MGIWRRKINIFTDCHHDWNIVKKSNVIQLDEMGYPLRLCICQCSKCGKSEQQWIDVNTSVLDEIVSGKSVVLKWEGISI